MQKFREKYAYKSSFYILIISNLVLLTAGSFSVSIVSLLLAAAIVRSLSKETYQNWKDIVISFFAAVLFFLFGFFSNVLGFGDVGGGLNPCSPLVPGQSYQSCMYSYNENHKSYFYFPSEFDLSVGVIPWYNSTDFTDMYFMAEVVASLCIIVLTAVSIVFSLWYLYCLRKKD